MTRRMNFRPSLKGNINDYEGTNFQYPVRLSNVFMVCNTENLTKYDIRFINFVNLTLGVVISNEDYEVIPGHEYPVHLKKFFFKIMHSRRIDVLDTCIEKMLSSTFTLNRFSHREKTVNIFSGIRYCKKEDRIYISFTEDFSKIYNKNTKYTHVTMVNIFDKLKSKYSLSVYPLFEAINSIYSNKISMSIDEFKTICGYTGSDKEFKRKCLDIVIKEVNENTRLNINIEKVKDFKDFRKDDCLYITSYIKDEDIKKEEKNIRDLNDKHEFLVPHRAINQAAKKILNEVSINGKGIRRGSLKNIYGLTLEVFNLRIHEIANEIINGNKLNEQDKEFVEELNESVELCFNNEMRREMYRMGDIKLDPHGINSENRIKTMLMQGRKYNDIKGRRLTLKEKNISKLYNTGVTIPCVLKNYQEED